MKVRPFRGYGQLQKLHVPLTGSHFGYSDILPKYANATGGEIFSGFSRDAIENTYAGALGEARNQYTLEYLTDGTPSSTHRDIEVDVFPSRPESYREGRLLSGWTGALNWKNSSAGYANETGMVFC